MDNITKADVNIPFRNTHGDIVGNPLFNAIWEDRMDYIDQFISLGADVNIVIKSYTPLLMAISKGNIDVVNRLLLAGANPNLVWGSDYSPLGAAVNFHNIDIIKLLMSFGANINYEDENISSSVLGIILADTRGQLNSFSHDVFNFLFLNGLDISRSIHDWMSLLVIRLIYREFGLIDKLKILKLFLEYCANPNMDYIIRKQLVNCHKNYADDLITMLLIGGAIFEEDCLENMILYNRLSSISYILENKLVSKEYIINHPKLLLMTDRNFIIDTKMRTSLYLTRAQLIHEINTKGHIGMLLKKYIYQ